MNAYIVELNDREMQILVQLIDLAVKAGGLQVAPAAVVMQQKLNTAMRKNNTELATEQEAAAEAN